MLDKKRGREVKKTGSSSRERSWVESSRGRRGFERVVEGVEGGRIEGSRVVERGRSKGSRNAEAGRERMHLCEVFDPNPWLAISCLYHML